MGLVNCAPTAVMAIVAWSASAAADAAAADAGSGEFADADALTSACG